MMVTQKDKELGRKDSIEQEHLYHHHTVCTYIPHQQNEITTTTTTLLYMPPSTSGSDYPPNKIDNHHTHRPIDPPFQIYIHIHWDTKRKKKNVNNQPKSHRALVVRTPSAVRCGSGCGCGSC